MGTWVSWSPYRQGQGSWRFNEGHLLNGLMKSYSICLVFHHYNSKGYRKGIAGDVKDTHWHSQTCMYLKVLDVRELGIH